MDDRNFRILYVDDETDLLTIGKLFMERYGNLTVDTSPSARDALEKIAQNSFDGIVSDYQMPGMDGIEFLQEVRRQYGDIPFILFTGRGREEVVIQAIDFGVDFYLQKGGEPKSQFAELVHKIRQAVRRKEAERAIKASEKRLSDIIDFLPDPTFAIDVSGKVIAWNHALEELTGSSSADIIGKGKEEYNTIIYGEDRPVLIDLIDEPDDVILQYYSHIQRSGTSITAETEYTHKNGSHLHILLKVSRLYDQAGTIAGAIESIRDITQLKQAEREIRKSEERYRSVVNDQTEMIARFSPEGIITFTNEAYRQYYAPRIGLEFPVGKNIRDIMEISNYSQVDAFFQSLTPETPVREMERMVPGKDGNTYWQIWAVRALFDEDGNISEYQVVGRDVTDKKLAEEKLRVAYEQIAADEEELREKYEELAKSEQLARESEERLVQAQEIAHTGAWEYNLKTGVIWGSAEGLAIFGYPPVAGDFPIEDIESCIPDRERVHQTLVDLLEHDTPYDIEYLIQPADGSKQKYIHSRARCERDSNGNIIRVLGVIQDITERKKAENEVAFKNVILQTQQEAALDGILIVDKNGLILGYNKKFQEVWGISDEIVLSRNDEQVLSSVLHLLADPDEFISRVRYLYEHPEEKSFEEVELQNGRILERFSSPMYGDAGEYFGRVWYFRDISERKRAEEELQAAYEQIQASEETLQTNYQLLLLKERALQESENRFRSLFSLAPYACVLYNQNGVHLFSNAYHEKITGYSSAEMEGKSARDFDIISPNDLDRITEKLNRQGYLDGEEVTIKAKDGTMKTVLSSAVFIQSWGERETLSTMIDVSERRRIEDSLRRSNDQITGIANTIPGIVFQFYAKESGEFGLSYVSSRVGEILGISGDFSTFLQKFIDGIVPEDRTRFSASIQQAVKNETKWEFEGRFRRPDGHIIYLRGISAPVREQNELLYSGVILDITAEKEADKSLQSERLFSRLLLDISPVFIVAIGADGKTIMMNRMLLDILEYSEEEVIGKDYLTAFVPAEDHEMVSDVFRKIVGDTSTTLNENRIVSKSGKIYLVEWRGRPVLNPSGELDFFVGIGIDITRGKNRL
ncbi:PAS domain S-box protein [Methanospirillum stamsii]